MPLPQPFTPKASNFRDRSGEKYGVLTALYCCGHHSDGKLEWVFKCACGNYTVRTPEIWVEPKDSLSCGCINHDLDDNQLERMEEIYQKVRELNRNL